MHQLAAHLAAKHREIYIDGENISSEDAAPYTLLAPDEISKIADLVIVLGGDGTMLTAARLMVPAHVPIVGINQGHLGFMTDIPLYDMIGVVDTILKGHYVSEKRILLTATVVREGNQVGESLALNEVVLNRSGIGQLIEFEVFINRQFVYTQRSDGLIITTPTGSTAYSLAAGGPILHPTLPALALVPICPQSMSNRPIVINDNCYIEILLTRGIDARVHCDGHNYYDLQEMDKIIIQRHPDSVCLLHPLDYNYYDTLRHKLHWGERLF